MNTLVKYISILAISLTVSLNTSNVKLSSVLALTDSELREKLDNIYFFGIYDKQSNERAEYENKEIFFLNEADAKKTLAGIHSKSPESSESVYIVRYSLEILRSKNDILYIPDLEEVNTAENLAKASPQPYQGGIPLYVSKVNDNYTILEKDSGEEIIPFFFKKQHLDSFMADMRAKNPELANGVKTEVVSFNNLIEILENNDNLILKKIQIIPYYWQP